MKRNVARSARRTIAGASLAAAVLALPAPATVSAQQSYP